VNSKHAKTLDAVFANPVSSSLEWMKVEKMLLAIGCDLVEGAGSRVRLRYGQHLLLVHRPHPTKEAKPYQVRQVRGFLELIGVTP
jgi:HicA toxin of bacterial toxin-antitoxin,